MTLRRCLGAFVVAILLLGAAAGLVLLADLRAPADMPEPAGVTDQLQTRAFHGHPGAKTYDVAPSHPP